MTARKVVLVTGATGHIGPYAVRALAEQGADVRAFVLDDDPGAAGLPDGVDVVRGDLADARTMDACLDDVDAVLLMWPFFTLNVDTAQDVLDTMRDRVRHIAFVSSIGVHLGLEPLANRCHSYMEGLIEKTDLDWTFLQTTGFASNAAGWAPQVRDGVVRFPHGAAARSPIHDGDLADVAVCALTGEGHAGKRYVVTGPEVLTLAEQARIIGEVIDRPVRWEDADAGIAQRQLVSAGWPESFAEGALEYFARLVDEHEPVTSTVAEVTGRPARTFRDWATEHAGDFR